MEQTDGLDMMVAPIGGGGMISGTCLTLSNIAPEVQIIAAEPEGPALEYGDEPADSVTERHQGYCQALPGP